MKIWTYDAAVISVEVIDDVRSVFVPQKHIATVTSADDVLAAWTIEVDTLHC